MKNYITICCATLSLLTLISSSRPGTGRVAQAADSLQVRVVKDGLTMPWEILWGPDDYIWMTEKSGKISRLNPASGQTIQIGQVPDVKVTDYGGLMGMVLHPDFARQPYVFVVYTYQEGSRFLEKVVRYSYRQQQLSQPTILVSGITGNQDHNGSRLLISPDLKLFVTTGDGNRQNVAQKLDSLNGKLLRLNLDGTIPADNPFPNSPVWSLGHRNQQGLVLVDDKMYTAEHGPNTDDEVNLIRKGGNYGWPNVAGYCDENQRGEKDWCATHQGIEPLRSWTPTIGLCALDYYNKPLFPRWKNSLLATSLKASRLLQLQLDETGTKVIGVNEFLVNQYGRLRDLCISPTGNVYVATNNFGNDKIIELTAKGNP
ncbi:PQQ-dependent sugar dehydrogenase [Fibrella forsythiae]|uniref:PQQ-dependent sugar dehydrogenase n=1 Tax=Fibrella forsythiae TaxID=2817061 RepID=A0ABS3JH96_9BACT|nr:PQQ-dependent sugar dehydrogenase [Fibrella forsythiae]MBO0949387.1 PQQ-dependent sugar dehydrogenase [Fibrella forsythiae]